MSYTITLCNRKVKCYRTHKINPLFELFQHVPIALESVTSILYRAWFNRRGDSHFTRAVIADDNFLVSETLPTRRRRGRSLCLEINMIVSAYQFQLIIHVQCLKINVKPYTNCYGNERPFCHKILK